MILTDYFRSTPDITWELGKQCGVDHGTIRLPEEDAFDPADRSHWQTVYDRFLSHGITPLVIEPMPNSLHDHIKSGDAKRDACIETVIGMLPIMDALNIRTICFNFMAYIGWYRTAHDIKERGNALVTGFSLSDFKAVPEQITEQELWENYTYFIKAVIPYAERYGIQLALHPDDPPLARLGNVSRIMVSYDNINRAVREIVSSPNLGVTMCQATFHMMGEDLYQIIPQLADKIFFIHFRNTTGTKTNFRETFHDNGDLNMPGLIQLYQSLGINVPIRVDHVPTMAGEVVKSAGYDAFGRLYAIGYLKGILQTVAL